MLLPPRWERFFFGHHKPADSIRFSVRRLRSIEVTIQRKLMVRVDRTAQEQLYTTKYVRRKYVCFRLSADPSACRLLPNRHSRHAHTSASTASGALQVYITYGTAHASAQYCTYTSYEFSDACMRQRNRIRGSFNPVECAQRPAYPRRTQFVKIIENSPKDHFPSGS